MNNIGFRMDGDIYAWEQRPDAVYKLDIPDDAILIPIEEFTLAAGGHGYPVRDEKMCKGRNMGIHCEFVLVFGEYEQIPKTATHIAWFVDL